MRGFSVVSGVLVVLLSGMCTGCLRKQDTHTLYVGPSGVVWSVIEKDVRSDGETAADRLREEHDYVLAASAGQHPVARAFRAIGAQSISTTWLRRERPFAVMTDARFRDLRDAANGILRGSGIAGTVSLTEDTCDTILTTTIDVEDGPENPDDDLVSPLFAAAAEYRIVLTEGRFISADGFVIKDGGDVAVPDETKTPEDGVLTLSLRWRGGACVTR